MSGLTRPEPRSDEPAVEPTEGQPRLLRVACPQGHKLDAPCILNGHDVVCPYCGERFLFSYEASEEFQQERHEQHEPERVARVSWLEWSAIAAAMAGMGLVAHLVIACLP